MSDIDRRTTIQRLEYIKSMEWRDWAKDALQFAINSLEVDEAYQLEYEQTTKNDLGVDCISRIETIDYLCKHCPDDGECFKDCDEIKHLRQMPSVTPQEPKWIPVSERLPEAEYGESDSVLVCFENETQDVLYFNGSNWCYPTGEIYIAVNHKNGWHNKVVAWMSLPKPYEPQESEG